MITQDGIALELGDIQAGALQPRPTPYAGAYLALRIDDRRAGRELLRRLIPVLDSVASFDPGRQVSLAAALTFQGLKALAVQEAYQEVLDNPEAEQALQHPALKPLLEQAAG